MVTDLPYVKVMTSRQSKKVVIFFMEFDYLPLKVSQNVLIIKRMSYYHIILKIIKKTVSGWLISPLTIP